MSNLRSRLVKASELAQQNLKASQTKMKTWYDKRARSRSFIVGEKVLALLPVPKSPLQARFCGPYLITKKINNVNYIIHTPDRRKSQRLCHVNMLKKYYEGEKVNITRVAPVAMTVEVEDFSCRDELSGSVRLKNSDVLSNLQEKLGHLPAPQQKQMISLIKEFAVLFPDVPGRTDCVYHDVDVMGATPIKQHPYHTNPVKLQYMRSEIEYMLANDLIEPSQSSWSSPCLLVPKGDGTHRFCTDFCKVNSVTKSDSFPIPRIEDCVDRIGSSKYVTKFDLLKGFWQVPLTDRAKEISTFATPDGLFQYKVMPFGMKNAPATFQRMINKVIAGLEGCQGYIDDVIVYGDTWEQHLTRVRSFLTRLKVAKLTVNLVKSDFGCAHVKYLGYIVGQGRVSPVNAKIEAIVEFPAPKSRKEVMRFLGMSGYYRKFCKNFSTVAAPMTQLLKKDQRFVWTSECQDAFNRIKSLLISAPVLVAPNFSKPFILTIDASDVGAGAVLMQEDSRGLDHPLSYFLYKFNDSQRNYSTSEKETLALLLALQHYDFYVTAAQFPLVVYTDHNPLVFLNRLKNKNQRLLCWSLTLQGYDLDIRHIPGRDNVIADALSRQH